MQYTFKCPKCGEFNLDLSLHDEQPTHCKICNSKIKRIFKANVNLNFNGSYNSTRNKK